MIFLSNNKKQSGVAKILRIFGSTLVSFVIAVNVFGAFAQVAFAALPQGVQVHIDKAAALETQIKTQAATIKAQGVTPQSATEIAALYKQYTDERLAAVTAVNDTSIVPTSQYSSVFAETQTTIRKLDQRGTLAAADEIAKLGAAQAAASGSLTQANQVAAAQQTITGAAGGTTPAPPKPPGNTPKHPLELCFAGTISMCVAGIFYVFFVDLTAPIAYLAGAVFDAFAGISLNSATYASTIIAKGWVIARDIANMAFVFILIYLAFMLILNLEGVGIGKQLAGVIAVALLINFSFFFSRVIIDVSNILAHQFYDNIVAAPAPSSSSFTVSGVQLAARGANAIGMDADIKSISAMVMTGINPQDLLGNTTFKEYIGKGSFFGNIAILITLFFIFGIINIILAFVFLPAAFQFLARIVTLWFAIILSPLAFISFILPPAKKWGGIWFNTIIKNAFYAPAFLFVIYIMIKMLDNGLLSQDIANSLLSAADKADANTVKGFLDRIVSVIVRLSIVVGLMIAALKIGSFMGTQGAKTAEKWAGKLAVGGNAAAVGWAARRSAGALGYVTSRASRSLASGAGGYNFKYNEKGEVIETTKRAGFSALLARTAGVGLGRAGESAGGALAGFSFDARASTLPGASMGGKAQTGGRKKDIEDRAKRLEGIEHDRHDTPEETAARNAKEKAVKVKMDYTGQEAAITAVLNEANRKKSESQAGMKAAEAAIERAQRSGDEHSEEAAREELRIRSEENARASAQAREHTNALKSLADTLKANMGPGNKERGAAYASRLETSGIHNLWNIPSAGFRSRADLRAAAKIRTGKSNKDKLIEAAQALAKEDAAPPPTPPAAAQTGGGGGATPPPTTPTGGGPAH